MSIFEVTTEVTGAVWKIVVEAGALVSEGDELVIFESMKMEVPVFAPSDGTVKEIRVKEGDVCNEGETVVILDV